MKIFLVTAVATVVVGGSLTGCAPRIGGDDYSVVGAGEVSHTSRGTIIAMRPVKISASSSRQDNQPGAGAGLGAAGGALLGSTVGQGKGSALGMLGGALLGGVAGHYAGQALTDQTGFEYQVQLHDGDAAPGSIITIAQGAEPKLAVGQRVLVIKSQRDRGRIIPDNSGRF